MQIHRKLPGSTHPKHSAIVAYGKGNGVEREGLSLLRFITPAWVESLLTTSTSHNTQENQSSYPSIYKKGPNVTSRHP